MSPRLDASQTQRATSTPPLERLEDESADENVGLAGLPEIPPFDEVGPVDARALSKTSSSDWSRWRKAPTSIRTSATPWSSSISPW